MKRCVLCQRGETDTRIIKNRRLGYLCSACYQREKSNPITYEKPGIGEVIYNEEGKPICHICGKAYDKVLSHAHQVHGISAREYKKEFGLDTTKGIMSKESTYLAMQRVYENYDKVIIGNLLIGGKGTRYEKGHKGRTKDMVSEQTRAVLASNKLPNREIQGGAIND